MQIFYSTFSENFRHWLITKLKYARFYKMLIALTIKEIIAFPSWKQPALSSTEAVDLSFT